MPVLVILAALLLIPVYIEAQSKKTLSESSESARSEFSPYSFSIAPLFGVLYGQADEIVYKFSDSSAYMSELLWDLKPLWYAGFAVNYGPSDVFLRNGFFANGSIKIGIPFGNGIIGLMEDSDWEYVDNSLTKYSSHDAKSRGSFLADISLGYSILVNSFFVTSLSLDFLYMHHSWTAKDGYYQYLNTDRFGNVLPGQVWTDDIPKRYLEGDVIRYEQNWYILSPGISLKGKLNNYFSLEALLNYSPLIFCADRDDHLLTETTYLDYNYYGHYYKAGGMFTFSPKKKLDLSIYFFYKNISGTRGDLYTDSFFFGGIAGAGYSAIDMGLITKISF